MDFRRAKLILIAAFAILDAFLFWRVSADARLAAPVGGTVSARVLALEGVELELPRAGRLPSDSQLVSLLSVRLAQPDAKALVASLYRGRPVQTSRFPPKGQAQAETFQTARERLAVLRDGVIQYQRIVPSLTAGPIDPATARRQSDAFIPRLGGFPPGAAFDYAGRVVGSALYEVDYVEVYDGLPLFPGYLDVGVDAHGVVSVRRYWLHVASPAGPKRATIGAAQAVLQLAADVHASADHRLRVADVRLGYYGLNTTAARQWQLVPVWRVRLAGGGIYYINAYTGVLEE